jgi:glucose/sorbosone dehydrogenase
MRAALLALALVLLCAAPAGAAPRLVEIGNFTAPVHVASPPGDSRVFVVEQNGLVKIAGGGTFLDATGLTDGGGERGLLSIAFAPDYAASGLFYVFLTTPGDSYELRVVEFRRSADPNRADPGSARVVLSIPHPNWNNHNGGQLQFGPDGMLYVGTGDGGGSHDAEGNAQRLDRLLGKILRIDPRTGAAAPGNPFDSRVWAFGLRNPWRFSFDRATGDLVIGDVGQSAFEEVDWARAAEGSGRGANYGWPCFDGNHPNPTVPSCSAPNAVPPAFERSHGEGFCAITGGYVVRDPGLPTLSGRYIYGDLCLGSLRSITLGGADDRVEPLAVQQPTSFGEDSQGRLYVASYRGPVYRIQDCAPGACPAPATPGPGAGADRTAPRLRVSVEGLRSAVRRRQLRVRVRCSERCRLTAGGRLRGVGPLKRARRTLAADRRQTVRLRMTRRRARQLRGALRRRGRVIAAVTVRARDDAGNERRVRRRARVRR